jgi:hypothetical protein
MAGHQRCCQRQQTVLGAPYLSCHLLALPGSQNKSGTKERGRLVWGEQPDSAAPIVFVENGASFQVRWGVGGPCVVAANSCASHQWMLCQPYMTAPFARLQACCYRACACCHASLSFGRWTLCMAKRQAFSWINETTGSLLVKCASMDRIKESVSTQQTEAWTGDSGSCECSMCLVTLVASPFLLACECCP